MRVGGGCCCLAYYSLLRIILLQFLGAGTSGLCMVLAEPPPPPVIGRGIFPDYRSALNYTEVSSQYRVRKKRSVVQLASMLRCVTGCSPLAYKGYGCYCGYMGSGLPVDDIDRCCLEHDWCYTHISCPQLLVYFVPYRWNCAAPGYPQCEIAASSGMPAECALQLCECDRAFAKCVRNFPCPKYKAMCRSTNYLSNVIMGRK